MHRKVGAMTFDKRVVLFIHVQREMSELKSGKECDGFVTLVNGADLFNGMIVVLLAFHPKHFVFLPFKKT